MRHPTAEIRFTGLHVETEVFADLLRNLPSMLRALRDPIEVGLPQHRISQQPGNGFPTTANGHSCLCMQDLLQRLWLLRPARRKLVILDSISGILKPGRLTLLLGAPSSGKTTLLKALAGQLHFSGLKVSGRLVAKSTGCMCSPPDQHVDPNDLSHQPDSLQSCSHPDLPCTPGCRSRAR